MSDLPVVFASPQELDHLLNRVRAQAWSEGHSTCCDDRCLSDGNPYLEVAE